MRVYELTGLTALLMLASCNASSDAPDLAELATSVPATADCADAEPLRQRATEDRLRVGEASSQQSQVVLGNRASFIASLALVAQLRCTMALPEGDGLDAALGLARAAGEASSFYDQATRWNEANHALARILEDLVQRLPPAAGAAAG